MKSLAIICTSVILLFAAEMPISDLKNELLKIERQKIMEDTDAAENSWISPIMLSATVDKSRDSSQIFYETKNIGMSLSQDIFRSGGITYSIEQAKASGRADLVGVDIQEASYLKQIYTLKAEIKRDTLKFQKTELSLENSKIDLFVTTMKYKAGSADITELNRATIDKDNARTELIIIKNTLNSEKFDLKKLIGEKKERAIVLPNIPLIGKQNYLNQNLELLQYDARVQSNKANVKVVETSYLPKLTFNGSLGYSDYSGNQLDYSGDNYMYGLTLSMPLLDINEKAAKESSRLQYMQTKTEQMDRKYELDEEYINSQIVEGVVTYLAIINVDNKDLLLRPGMSANANIVTQTVKDAYIIPRSALLFMPVVPKVKTFFSDQPREKMAFDPKPHVWVLKETKPQKIYVTVLGSNNNKSAIVSDMLKPKDAIIVSQEIQQ